MTDIETIQVPHRMIDLADRRTRAIIQRSVAFPDALRVIAWSCYLQGLEDGSYATTRRSPAQAQEPT